MTAYKLTQGKRGRDGTGLSLFAWSNMRSTSSGDATGTLRYLDTWGARRRASANNASGASRTYQTAPRNGTLKSLYCCHQNTTAPVAITYTVYVNGVATAITVTIPAASVAVVGDTTHTASVTMGDRVQLISSNGSATGSNQTFYPQGTVVLF